MIQCRLEVSMSVGLTTGIQFMDDDLLQAADLIPDGRRSTPGGRISIPELRINRSR